MELHGNNIVMAIIMGAVSSGVAGEDGQNDESTASAAVHTAAANSSKPSRGRDTSCLNLGVRVTQVELACHQNPEEHHLQHLLWIRPLKDNGTS
jgi:hypothetical protein